MPGAITISPCWSTSRWYSSGFNSAARRVSHDSSTVGGAFRESRKGHAPLLLLSAAAGTDADAAVAAMLGAASCGVTVGAGPVADA
jgi:hypothetical protein